MYQDIRKFLLLLDLEPLRGVFEILSKVIEEYRGSRDHVLVRNATQEQTGIFTTVSSLENTIKRLRDESADLRDDS